MVIHSFCGYLGKDWYLPHLERPYDDAAVRAAARSRCRMRYA
jgi:hypothetical protein